MAEELKDYELRAKIFQVNAELLLVLGIGKFRVVANPLPEDAKIITVQYDEKTKIISLVISSETFEPVVDDSPLETLPAPVIGKGWIET